MTTRVSEKGLETRWVDQWRIAELFGVDVPAVSYHLKEVCASGELAREATLRRLPRVHRERRCDVWREIEFYNLDDIISVGYRVDGTQATQFEPLRRLGRAFAHEGCG